MDEFFDALREEPLDNWYEIGNVFCIVDALLDEDMSEEEYDILAGQAADAGCLVLSRTQLADEAGIQCTISRVNESLARIGCKSFFAEKNIFAKTWDELNEDDYLKLTQTGYKIRDHVKKFTLDDTSFDTKCFLNLHMDINRFGTKVKYLFENDECGHIVRVKGYIPFEAGFYQVNATDKAIRIDEKNVGQEVLIVIGTGLSEAKIEEVLLSK